MENICTDFVKYFAEFSRIKLLRDDFRKTVLKLTMKLYGQYNGEKCATTVKKNIVEKFIEYKTFFRIFLTHFFYFFTLASNLPPFII